MKQKWFTFLLIIIMIAGITVFDVVRAGMFHINVVSINPNPSVADGQSPVSIQLKLTDNDGKPVKGHALFALSRNGGTFKSNRQTTDKSGIANFTYYPYKVSAVMDLKDVIIDVVDESNSVVIEINSKTTFDVKLIKPKTDSSSSTDLDDIFGEKT